MYSPYSNGTLDNKIRSAFISHNPFTTQSKEFLIQSFLYFFCITAANLKPFQSGNFATAIPHFVHVTTSYSFSVLHSVTAPSKKFIINQASTDEFYRKFMFLSHQSNSTRAIRVPPITQPSWKFYEIHFLSGVFIKKITNFEMYLLEIVLRGTTHPIKL